MPVPKITADQFATSLNTGIQSRDSSVDIEIGPVPDVVVQPTAQVLENQNDRIRQVSQLILLDQSTQFADSDTDSFVYNETLIRNVGGKSSGTVTFSRATAPDVDIPVQRGFPIGTLPDESTGQTIIFVTTESGTLPATGSSAYFNIATNRYELEIAVQATTAGTLGEVGPNRINRPLRPLAGFDTVTNPRRTSAVVDRETNQELLERYKIAITGTQLAVKNGLSLFIKSQFPDAGSILVVYPDDPLVTRSGVGGNAVDIYVTGIQSTVRSDTKTYTGLGQVMVFDHQPVIDIVSISGYVLDTDYVLVKDTTGVSSSTRGLDGVKFIPGGASPTVGTTFVVNYDQNLVVEDIQNIFLNADYDIGGQDPLIRAGIQTDMVMAATLIVLPGFSHSTVESVVITTIETFINALGLGAPVQKSDIDAAVRAISGIDNFIFTVFDRTDPGTGNADVDLAKNEFPRITSSDITIS
jgi:uncharacterized phage protein gp47/JayE